MARFEKRLVNNAAGQFFVDSTCINCDTCRELAPASFREEGDVSVVWRQPVTKDEKSKAYQALLACPVGSIGSREGEKVWRRTVRDSFPLHINGHVFYCGFSSAKSFGGKSYFLQHPEGNWLIDSPRYMNVLVDSFEKMGGIRYMFLTHEDDVADAERYAERFSATRVIHQADQRAQPDAEWIIRGTKVVEVTSEFLIIPVPGHTPGSMALLYNKQYLFSGDHLWWDPEKKGLRMPAVYIWDQAALLHSTEQLTQYPFEWVLPGHGHRVQLTQPAMSLALQTLLESRQPICK